jgi:hypothetical protein
MAVAPIAAANSSPVRGALRATESKRRASEVSVAFAREAVTNLFFALRLRAALWEQDDKSAQQRGAGKIANMTHGSSPQIGRSRSELPAQREAHKPANAWMSNRCGLPAVHNKSQLHGRWQFVFDRFCRGATGGNCGASINTTADSRLPVHCWLVDSLLLAEHARIRIS